VPSTNGAPAGAAQAQAILAGAQAERLVLQDFCPLADSLDWQLGQLYWRQRGSKAFTNDAIPVPFVVNNDGTLSQHCAELVFASLVAAETKGTLEPQVFVLELGIGVGLFARFFLDAFRDLCRQHHKDYYHRLCYVAADRSEQMLADACRNGIFASHPGHYLVRVVDALDPQAGLERDIFLTRRPGPPFRAVFLNYLLDCLPAADLRLDNGEARRLCVRTCLARHVNLGDFTNLSPQELVRLAQTGSARDQQFLLELSGFFASEYAYLPVDLGQLPYGDFARDFARSRTGHVLHNYGAIQSLERLLDMVREDGFILINDYGTVHEDANSGFEHQHFSRSTSVGLNFPLLKAFFGDRGHCGWFEPAEDRDGIYSRLLGRRLAPETLQAFGAHFSKGAQQQQNAPWDAARANGQMGRFEATAAAYHEAVARQPYNWLLLNEVALFLTFTMRQARAGLALVKLALDLNPACSAELWNTCGDCHYESGELDAAQRAYERALQINPDDVRGRFNLAWVRAQQRRYREALVLIGEGLALDEMGQYRDRLLQKQAEVLAALAQRQQMRFLLQANRVSPQVGPAKDPGKVAVGERPAL
jgi:tetratricopeptide (TPR) repeat protein